MIDTESNHRQLLQVLESSLSRASASEIKPSSTAFSIEYCEDDLCVQFDVHLNRLPSCKVSLSVDTFDNAARSWRSNASTTTPCDISDT